jgi:hypothetical protein
MQSEEPPSPDDVKLVTLARANRARARTSEGAAVRDTDGRSYSAASVDLPSLRLSALELAVAMAASSGVKGLESDRRVVRDFAGGGVMVYRADPSGAVTEMLTT